jgi:hypothetical protein
VRPLNSVELSERSVYTSVSASSATSAESEVSACQASRAMSAFTGGDLHVDVEPDALARPVSPPIS